MNESVTCQPDCEREATTGLTFERVVSAMRWDGAVARRAGDSVVYRFRSADAFCRAYIEGTDLCNPDGFPRPVSWGPVSVAACDYEIVEDVDALRKQLLAKSAAVTSLKSVDGSEV